VRHDKEVEKVSIGWDVLEKNDSIGKKAPGGVLPTRREIS
jgi:hypothetical protein